MIRSIAKSAEKFQLDTEQLKEAKGNYQRKARMYAVYLESEEGNPTMKELYDMANDCGMNPEQSSFESFRQRFYSFERTRDSIVVLPINRCYDNTLDHLRIVADKLNTSVSVLYKSKTRVFQAARLNILRRNEESYGKEVMILMKKRLELRLL